MGLTYCYFFLDRCHYTYDTGVIVHIIKIIFEFDIKTERQRVRKTGSQSDRETERQSDRETERQSDRATERQRDRATE